MQSEIPVSIVLPTYNRAGKVGKAVESVLAQTYPYFELSVVDDGSTDDTEQIIRSYHDDRIVYYKMQQNGGQSKARNCGMQMAQYDYIAFEDSDDLWRARKLEKQMKQILSDKNAGFCYHKLRYDMGAGQSITLPDERIASEKKSGDIYAQLLWDNMIGMPTLLVKKECVEQIGGLDEKLKCLEDYDFALRIAQKYQAVFLDEVLLDAEFSALGVSGDSEQYLIASCILLQRYKKDYLQTDTFNHRVEIILRDAERLGITAQVVQLLEKLLQLQ